MPVSALNITFNKNSDGNHVVISSTFEDIMLRLVIRKLNNMKEHENKANKNREYLRVFKFCLLLWIKKTLKYHVELTVS